MDAGQQQDTDPEIVVVMDAGYDVVRLAWFLRDLPVILVGRLRSDRVFYAPAGERRSPIKGRQPRHGAKLVLRDKFTPPAPVCSTQHDLERYGNTRAVAFARMHPKIDSRGGFKDHQGPLPVVVGTLIGVEVERLPGNRDPKPLWLWASKPMPANAGEMDHWWSMCLRRFDLEHTFRFLKQGLGGGPDPGCTVRRRPTAGPGSWWSPMRCCAWPAPWPPNAASPGNSRSHHRASAPRGCGRPIGGPAVIPFTRQKRR